MPPPLPPLPPPPTGISGLLSQPGGGGGGEMAFLPSLQCSFILGIEGEGREGGDPTRQRRLRRLLHFTRRKLGEDTCCNFGLAKMMGSTMIFSWGGWVGGSDFSEGSWQVGTVYLGAMFGRGPARHTFSSSSSLKVRAKWKGKEGRKGRKKRNAFLLPFFSVMAPI